MNKDKLFVLCRRIAFKNYEERRKAAEKVKKEATRIEETFDKLATKDINVCITIKVHLYSMYNS